MPNEEVDRLVHPGWREEEARRKKRRKPVDDEQPGPSAVAIRAIKAVHATVAPHAMPGATWTLVEAAIRALGMAKPIECPHGSTGPCSVCGDEG